MWNYPSSSRGQRAWAVTLNYSNPQQVLMAAATPLWVNQQTRLFIHSTRNHELFKKVIYWSIYICLSVAAASVSFSAFFFSPNVQLFLSFVCTCRSIDRVQLAKLPCCRTSLTQPSQNWTTAVTTEARGRWLCSIYGVVHENWKANRTQRVAARLKIKIHSETRNSSLAAWVHFQPTVNQKGDSGYPIMTPNPSVQVHAHLHWLQACAFQTTKYIYTHHKSIEYIFLTISYITTCYVLITTCMCVI